MHLQTILLPTDFSEPSQAALHFAADLARDHGALLTVLHVVETLGPENVTYGEAESSPQPETYRRRLWDDLHRMVPSLPDVRVQYVLGQAPHVEAILKLAVETNCDLIVMGSHGLTGIKRLLMGSLTEEVVRKAACPVLVVKAGMVPPTAPGKAAGAPDPSFLVERPPDS